jgi:hypothetical protein
MVVNIKHPPKSTACPCLIRVGKLESSDSNRNYPKKAMKEDPQRVLSISGAILDKVPPYASFKP